MPDTRITEVDEGIFVFAPESWPQDGEEFSPRFSGRALAEEYARIWRDAVAAKAPLREVVCLAFLPDIERGPDGAPLIDWSTPQGPMMKRKATDPDGLVEALGAIVRHVQPLGEQDQSVLLVVHPDATAHVRETAAQYGLVLDTPTPERLIKCIRAEGIIA